VTSWLRPVKGGESPSLDRVAAERTATERATTEPGPEPTVPVQSVDRALTVLEILATRGPTGVTEVATELGVHKSTVSRLLAVLESRGFVEQLADRGKYRLGFGVARLAGALTVQQDLATESRSACEALAQDVRETVNLAVLGDTGRDVNLSEVRGPASISSHNWVGQSTHPHATSSGKVMLAWTLEPDLRALLGEALPRFTERTITSYAELGRQLSQVRARGWATTVEEYELGLNALAAPVRDHRGRVVAAVSVSGPSYRLTEASFDRVAPRLLEATAEISRRLGHLA